MKSLPITRRDSLKLGTGALIAGVLSAEAGAAVAAPPAPIEFEFLAIGVCRYGDRNLAISARVTHLVDQHGRCVLSAIPIGGADTASITVPPELAGTLFTPILAAAEAWDLRTNGADVWPRGTRPAGIYWDQDAA